MAQDEIAADTITSDLKTNNNTLSFWESELDGEPLYSMAALALAAAADKVDKLDIAWLDSTALSDRGIAFERTSGQTPVTDLRERHVDAVSLDARRLLVVAEELAHTVRERGRFRRFSGREITRLLTEAVRANRLQLADLKDSVRKAVNDELASTR